VRRALACAGLAALGLAVGLAGPLDAGAQSDDRAERLERIREEIEDREARAREYAEDAEGALGELEAIDRELTELRRSARRLRTRQKAARAELSEAQARLVGAKASRDEIAKALRARLVALYKFRSTGGIPALYSARDFQAVARLEGGMSRVLAEDGRLFERYREATVRWQEGQAKSQALVDELAAARREIDQRREREQEQQVERRNLVALMTSRADRERAAAEELREAGRRLEKALADLPRGSHPAGEGLRRGQVAWPVQGVVRLAFGRQVDPEFGTSTRRTGLEIAAERGAEVRAVAPGRVLFAGWFRGYGQMVIIDHGRNTLSVSGYLEELHAQADDVVGAGERIGTAGDTGSLSGPGLYFEIRESGTPVDPALWLE
jgi:septal ring factor EnvC (AmiA/AmiB activator)